MDPATLAHAFAVFALFGLIWTIQLVHYPAFEDIELRRFPSFHDRHSRNIGIIVFPLMLTELLSSIFLFINLRDHLNIALLVLSTLTWLITIIVFVPIHRTISRRPKPADLAKLVQLNWIRTIIWTITAAVTIVTFL